MFASADQSDEGTAQHGESMRQICSVFNQFAYAAGVATGFDHVRTPQALATGFDHVRTPQAFANASPGLLQPWDKVQNRTKTLKVFDLLSELLRS